MDTGERIKQIFTMKSTTTDYLKVQRTSMFAHFCNVQELLRTVCPRYGAWILVRVQMGRSDDDYTAVSTPL